MVAPSKKRSIFIVVIAIAILVGVGVYTGAFWGRPRLTILINGSPAANLIVTDFQTMEPCKLDGTGSISYVNDRSKQNAVFVRTKDGTNRLVTASAWGHTTVDWRGRLIVSKTVVYNFGFIRSEKITKQYDLTDAEVTAIWAGEVTLSQVEKAIMAEAEQ